jgi:general secretion pathway protein M
MIEAVKNWYINMSLRERVMVGVAVGLSAVLVAIYGLYLPLTNAITDQRIAYREALERRVSVEAMVAELRSNARRGIVANELGALEPMIRATATEAGFSVDELTSQGQDRVALYMAQAKSAALMKWIAETELSGVLVETVEIKQAGDQTVAARIVLTRAGR